MKKQITFYSTIEELTDRALCQIVEKCYHSGSKAVVLVSNPEIEDKINKLLWTYSQKQFIPHGSSMDPLPEKQPIYITHELKNPNKATILILLNLESSNITQYIENDFQRIIIIHNSNQELLPVSSINKSKFDLNYYTQSLTGGWVCMPLVN
jgi:DNA polymerase III subunit chi